MSPNPFVRCLFTLICLGYCLTPCAHAQVPPYDPVQDATYSPLKSYHGADIDSVDLDTGTLAVKVPILSYPQRGGVLRLDFTMVGTQPGAVLQKDTIPFQNGNQIWVTCTVLPGGCIHSQPNPNPSLIFNGFPCVAASSVPSGSLYVYWASILDFDGSSRVIGWVNQNQGRSLDGSGYLVNGAPPGTGGSCTVATSGSIVDSRGVQVSYNSGNSSFIETDPNGNQITYLTTNGMVTDTMGRQIPALGSNSSWSVPGINGGTEIFQASHPSQNVYLWTLPNGTSYSFQYTNVSLPLLKGQTTAQQIALLTQVTLPTGGNISWTYSATPIQSPCVGGNYYFQVLNRSVNANDGTGAHTWTYSYLLSSTASGVTTVTDPLGDKTIYTYGLTSCKPYPTQTQNYDNNGNLLQTSTRTYSYVTTQTVSPPALNVNLTSQVTAWPNGQQSSTTNSYDRDNGHSYPFYTTLEYRQDGSFFGFSGNGSAPAGYTGTPWTVTKSDWGNGAPGATLQKTSTTFSAFSGPNAASYLANNILQKPYTVQVLNGSGTQVALTQYNYDENTPAASGLTTSYQWTPTPPAGAYRGNNTSLYRWLNSGTLTCPNGNSGGSGSNVISRMTYYDGGMLHTSAAPCGGAANYTYSGNYWYAYPTSISNALNQSTSYVYDFNTGLVSSVTDPNNQTSNYTYDSMWRLNCANYPDGGQQCTTYQESSFPFTSTFKKNITSAPLQAITITTVDGLGRPSQAQLTTDPDGPTFTDTVYDALGRVYSTSNPYRSKSESTYGVTSYTYDPLGRTCVIAPPDGTALPSGSACPATSPANDVFTIYSGNVTTTSDQAGKSHKSASDGLGRLTDVWEDPAGLNYHTVYTYDALGNLLTVLQNGSRNRSFVYDSLSRSTSATNPESGSVSYTYDPNGNLTSKTSPAPNQTGTATVTLSYCYDALNRTTSKAYTSQSCPMASPVATYLYDQTSYNGLTLTNGIGRRTGMADQAGAEAWSYDSMGRVLLDKRTTNSVSKTIPYTYNLDGSLASVATPTFPDGSHTITLAYTPGGAGRPLALLSSGTNLIVNAMYTPAGQLCNSLGLWNANWTAVRSFNNRLQPTFIYAVNQFPGKSSPAPPPCAVSPILPQTGYQFNAVALTYNYNGANNHNNGNVQSITDNLASWRSQSFTYDSLNRLASAQTTGTHTTNPTDCWAESYAYDAWGNLLSDQPNPTTQSAYTGCAAEATFSTSANTKNQIALLAYDAAGNVTTSCGVYMAAPATCTYDAENHITQFSWSGGSTTYTYDGDGKRVMKSGSPGTIYWYGSGSEALIETDTSNNNQAVYGYFAGQRALRVLPSNEVGFYFADHLGNTRFFQSLAGYNVSAFYPFGGERVYTTGTTTHYKFTGKERDSESGLDNFGARYMGSSLGRFMSPDPDNAGADPESPQSWNAYSYVLNNPLSSIDPDGLDCVYLNDAGTAVDGAGGVDRNSNKGECGQNGGTWFDGRINSNSVRTDPSSDWVSAEGVVGDIGSNLQFSCGGSACSQDSRDSFINSITGGPSSVTVYDTSGALVPDAAAILGQVYRDAQIVESGPLWAGCTAIGGILGQPPSFEEPLTHAGIEGTAKALENPRTATLAARAYHTATDARFTAGGKFSKVLVPRTAKALSPALHAGGKAVSVVGWGLLAYDTYQAGGKCAPIMKH